MSILKDNFYATRSLLGIPLLKLNKEITIEAIKQTINKKQKSISVHYLPSSIGPFLSLSFGDSPC